MRKISKTWGGHRIYQRRSGEDPVRMVNQKPEALSQTSKADGTKGILYGTLISIQAPALPALGDLVGMSMCLPVLGQYSGLLRVLTT